MVVRKAKQAVEELTRPQELEAIQVSTTTASLPQRTLRRVV